MSRSTLSRGLRVSSIEHQQRQELERLAAAWGAHLAVEDLAVEDLAVEDLAVEDLAVEDLAVEDLACLREIEGSRPGLVRFARSLCHDEHEAEDIVQDALVVALSKRHAVRWENSFAWLRAVVRWIWWNRLRRDRTRRRHMQLFAEAIRGEAWQCAR